MRIAQIIAPEGFRDEEFLIPNKYFKEQGAEVVVFSTKKGIAKGSLGAEVEVDKTIDELNIDDFDAIVLTGGPGTPLLRKSKVLEEKIREAYKKGKVIAAICWSPTVLAQAGVLKNKKATVWFGKDIEASTTKEFLEKHGAIYTGKHVEIDGKIITADGPRAALDYAKEIVKALKE